MSVAYSEPYQRSKKYFAKIFNTEKLLSIFEKRSTLDIWQGSEYTSGCWNLFFFFPHLFLIFQNRKPWCKRRCAVTTHQTFSSWPTLEYKVFVWNIRKLNYLLFPKQLAKDFPKLVLIRSHNFLPYQEFFQALFHTTVFVFQIDFVKVQRPFLTPKTWRNQQRVCRAL